MTKRPRDTFRAWCWPILAAMVACAVVVLVPACAWAEEPAAAPTAEAIAFFESKIRPILVENCYDCHAADTDQKGSLLLDTKAGLLKGGDTGPALVAGDPAKSLIIQAL